MFELQSFAPYDTRGVHRSFHEDVKPYLPLLSGKFWCHENDFCAYESKRRAPSQSGQHERLYDGFAITVYFFFCCVASITIGSTANTYDFWYFTGSECVAYRRCDTDHLMKIIDTPTTVQAIPDTDTSTSSGIAPFQPQDVSTNAVTSSDLEYLSKSKSNW